MGEASYIPGICILRDRKNKIISLSQASYIDKVLERFTMIGVKPNVEPTASDFHISLNDCPNTVEEREHMIGSLMYEIFYTRRDIFFAMGMALAGCKAYIKNLTPIGYTDSEFQTYKDPRKLTSGSVFVLSNKAIVWRSVKETCTTDSTMEAEYVVASKIMKEVIWL
ncbi:gag/pol protein [Gossypium australe]|uniref:Gag/pol protein n=1 Tax=Gossypium australe TaxID=47621 RepID=A0A5B6X310_9ROSI|nr:gag/pol protein [Gossypium australe]